MSIEQSRRDDLESLLYIIVYMIKGKLPWQGLVLYDDETRMRKIAEMKASISPDKISEDLSSNFAAFFKYSRSLKFQETPSYTYLTKLLNDAANEKGIDLEEHIFEWISTRNFSIKSSTKTNGPLIGTEVGRPSGDTSSPDP